MQEDIVVPIAGMIFTLALLLGFPIMRAVVKRMERESLLPRRSPETDERLERIEHAVDAMAVEVERIAEGQRFVTRLLSERAPERVAIPAHHPPQP